MAVKPKTICTYPGCGRLVDSGRCPEHQTKTKRRTSTSRMGYDRAWQRISARFLAANPYCQYRTHCNGARATQVDHYDGNTQNRDESNLVASCARCHSHKTATRDVTRDKRGRFDGSRHR